MRNQTKELTKQKSENCFASKKGRARRGEIYYADLGKGIGSEQAGVRPVLVIQNDTGNKHSPTVIVTPVTSHLEKCRLPTHVRLYGCGGLAKVSVALAEQIRTIDHSRLLEYIGQISEDEQRRVDHALAVSIGLHSNSKST